jgi:hypothetical protein
MCSGSAARYPVGTHIDMILSELGPPDSDRPYADSPESLCPPRTVRLVHYTGPRVPFLIHGALAILCVDSSNRVIKVLFPIREPEGERAYSEPTSYAAR